MTEDPRKGEFVPHSVVWRDRGSPGAADLINRVSGLVIEVGGPTDQGYGVVGVLDQLRVKLKVTNVDVFRPRWDTETGRWMRGEAKVDEVLSGESIPYKDGAIGCLMASSLPIEVYPRFIEDAERVLEENGVLVMQGFDGTILPLLRKRGFREVELSMQDAWTGSNWIDIWDGVFIKGGGETKDAELADLPSEAGGLSPQFTKLLDAGESLTIVSRQAQVQVAVELIAKGMETMAVDVDQALSFGNSLMASPQIAVSVAGLGEKVWAAKTVILEREKRIEIERVERERENRGEFVRRSDWFRGVARDLVDRQFSYQKLFTAGSFSGYEASRLTAEVIGNLDVRVVFGDVLPSDEDLKTLLHVALPNYIWGLGLREFVEKNYRVG